MSDKIPSFIHKLSNIGTNNSSVIYIGQLNEVRSTKQQKQNYIPLFQLLIAFQLRLRLIIIRGKIGCTIFFENIQSHTSAQRILIKFAPGIHIEIQMVYEYNWEEKQIRYMIFFIKYKINLIFCILEQYQQLIYYFASILIIFSFINSTMNTVSQVVIPGTKFFTNNKQRDLQHMKKVILAEITDVTEEDLNVMSKEQITSFYNQLMAGVEDVTRHPQTHRDRQASIYEDRNSAKDDTKANNKTLNQEKNQKGNENDQRFVTIGQEKYMVPKYLSQQSYQLNNKRFQILCGPEVETVAQKRDAIIAAYNPSVANTIRALKYQQIQQTYNRLRFPQKKQFYQLKVSQWPTQTKIFCIYIPKEPKDSKFEEFQAKITAQRAKYEERKKKRQVKQPQQNKQIKPSKTDTQPRESLRKLLEMPEEEDAFFNESFEERSNKTEQNPKSTLKVASIKPTKQPNIKQKIESSKRKSQMESSVQTENGKEQNKLKTKTKLTIISQVQYIQPTETCSHEGQEDERQLEPELRTRPLATQYEIEQGKQTKLKYKQLEKAILSEQNQPNQLVLDWIADMKKAVQLLEEGYVSQFDQNWTLVQ